MSSTKNVRIAIHRAFAILFLVATAVEVPLSWILWNYLSGSTNGAEAVANFIAPVVLAAVLWFAYDLYADVKLGIICWFAMMIIVAKAITIIGVIVTLLPLSALHSDFTQVVCSGVALMAAIYPKRDSLALRKSEIVISLIGVIVIAGLLIWLDIVVLFMFAIVFWTW